MADIQFSRVVKTYDNGFTAVKGIDLHIKDHEFMVLVGPSGCGKTTSLRMIAGLEDITGGVLVLGQRRINDVEPKDRDIAMVFQSYALYPHMTVYDNMAFSLKLKTLPRAEIHARVEDAVRVLGLGDHLHKLPKLLSGGQRQRVALGRAIVRNPSVYLFDEPLSNLDAKLRGEMRFELKTLQQRLKTTMVYVTHDQVEAMTLGDRITVMSHGDIQQVAQPTVIYEFPYNRFVAAFMGSPGMNFLNATLERNGDDFVLALTGGQRVAATMGHQVRLAEFAGKPVILGIRPENFAHGGFTQATPGSSTITMTVTVVELMGDHQYVYLTCPGQDKPLIMKCSAKHQAVPGSQIAVHCDLTAAHVFGGTDEHAPTLTLPPNFPVQQ